MSHTHHHTCGTRTAPELIHFLSRRRRGGNNVTVSAPIQIPRFDIYMHAGDTFSPSQTNLLTYLPSCDQMFFGHNNLVLENDEST